MDGGTVLRTWIPLGLGLWILLYLFVLWPGAHDPIRWIGLVLGLVGLVGVILARHTLGRSFSIRAKATALVTTGIYSRIRNPIYVFGMVFAAGIFLMVRKPAFWILWLLMIPIQITRARREARVLEDKFGDAYREYRKRT